MPILTEFYVIFSWFMCFFHGIIPNISSILITDNHGFRKSILFRRQYNMTTVLHDGSRTSKRHLPLKRSLSAPFPTFQKEPLLHRIPANVSASACSIFKLKNHYLLLSLNCIPSEVNSLSFSRRKAEKHIIKARGCRGRCFTVLWTSFN